MKQRFADTSYYLALLNATDAHHSAAIEESRRSSELVTHAWVVTELANSLSDARNRGLFWEFYREISADRRITIVPPTETLFNRGLQLHSQRSDKDWSLTDCISFVVMEDFGIVDALTADRHFDQAGFQALLRRQ